MLFYVLEKNFTSWKRCIALLVLNGNKIKLIDYSQIYHKQQAWQINQ